MHSRKENKLVYVLFYPFFGAISWRCNFHIIFIKFIRSLGKLWTENFYFAFCHVVRRMQQNYVKLIFSVTYFDNIKNDAANATCFDFSDGIFCMRQSGKRMRHVAFRRPCWMRISNSRHFIFFVLDDIALIVRLHCFRLEHCMRRDVNSFLSSSFCCRDDKKLCKYIMIQISVSMNGLRHRHHSFVLQLFECKELPSWCFGVCMCVSLDFRHALPSNFRLKSILKWNLFVSTSSFVAEEQNKSFTMFDFFPLLPSFQLRLSHRLRFVRHFFFSFKSKFHFVCVLHLILRSNLAVLSHFLLKKIPSIHLVHSDFFLLLCIVHLSFSCRCLKSDSCSKDSHTHRFIFLSRTQA